MKRRITLGFGLLAALASLGGCVLGSKQPPGCRAGHPEDCGAGFVCRAGACFRYNNEAGAPIDTSRDGGTDGAADATAG